MGGGGSSQPWPRLPGDHPPFPDLIPSNPPAARLPRPLPRTLTAFHPNVPSRRNIHLPAPVPPASRLHCGADRRVPSSLLPPPHCPPRARPRATATHKAWQRPGTCCVSSSVALGEGQTRIRTFFGLRVPSYGELFAHCSVRFSTLQNLHADRKCTALFRLWGSVGHEWVTGERRETANPRVTGTTQCRI